MDLLDVVLVVAVLAAVVAGYRRGLTMGGLAALGFLAGLAGGAALAGTVPPHLHGLAPTWRTVVAVALLLGGGFIGNAVGAAVGIRLRRTALRTRLGRLDSWLGAGFGGLAGLLVIWFLGLTFSNGPIPQLSRAIQASAVLRALDAHVPRPPAVFATLEQLLAEVPFPEVFVNLVPPLPGPVPLPPDLAALPGVAQAARETVRIVSDGCGGVEEGSGFPVGPELVLTNAHVVAGGSGTVVQPPTGGSLAATVVLFDPLRDVAILRVPGLRLPALAFARHAGRGAAGAVIGYPQGGPERVVPAASRGTLDAVGRDIYAQAIVTREIEVLDARIRPGNSGGPFIARDGRVLGVVFAKSTVTAGLGFALTAGEVRPDVRRAVGRQAAVSTGACVA